ncbi:hypothetical protein V5799_023465 [Amblyomma americanum]|uniref:Uncharacterized protein n=1 Tax=Amblyomma americanum TaxID=6943 RepID=A0AAQ4FJH9_AMBAM
MHKDTRAGITSTKASEIKVSTAPLYCRIPGWTRLTVEFPLAKTSKVKPPQFSEFRRKPGCRTPSVRTFSAGSSPPRHETRINGYRLRRCSRVHQLQVAVKIEVQEGCSISEWSLWTHGTLTSALNTFQDFQLMREANE